MNDYKSILTSKTVWGGIIAIAASAAGYFGYQIDTNAQASLLDLVTSAAGVIGGAVAIWGRIVATKKIG